MAKKQKKNRPGRLAVKLLAFAVLIVLCFQLVNLHSRITQARDQAAELTLQVQALTQANAQLSDEIENADDVDLIRDIARSELGLVEPGEKVFYDTSN